MHASQHSADYRETRPGNFRRPLEIEHPQVGTKINMIFYLKRKFAGFTPAANFIVCRFVIAIGNTLVKQVRHSQHQFVQFAFSGLHFGLHPIALISKTLYAVKQCVRIFAFSFRLTDSFRCGVTLVAQLLYPLLCGFSSTLQCFQRRRIQFVATAGQVACHQFRIASQQFCIQHRRLPAPSIQAAARPNHTPSPAAPTQRTRLSSILIIERIHAPCRIKFSVSIENAEKVVTAPRNPIKANARHTGPMFSRSNSQTYRNPIARLPIILIVKVPYGKFRPSAPWTAL